MVDIQIGKVNNKETLVYVVKNNAELQESIRACLKTGTVKGIWACCAIMEKSDKGPIPVVVLESDVLNEMSVADIVREKFPEYDYVDGYYNCGFRITALKQEQIFREDSYTDISERFI